ncbi:MAG TPA: VOC family protein [Chthoniobacterales bacterium]|nr:VOC family protein [Chthoniobacterales bacterium]
MQKINPFLWFDSQAEEAAKFYTSVFKSSKIGEDNALSRGSGEEDRSRAGIGDDGGVYARWRGVRGPQRRPAVQVHRGGLIQCEL